MSAAEALGLPPGVRFEPTGEELVEFYLLPRALGRPPAVPGIIIEDAASSTSACHPWKLLTRHRRTDDDEAYFFEGFAGGDHDNAKGGGARQARGCGSRWTWVAQKRWPDEALLSVPGGEQVSWGKLALNLQEGRRKSGSTGWVLHEYTVASPEGAFPVKLCHVAFTGRGQKRQRVPDDDDDGGGGGDGEGGGQDLEPQAAPPTHKRDATASSVVTTATPDQEDLGGAGRAQDQEEQCLSYGTSSVGDFWGSDDAGFSQESSVLNPWYPDAGPGGPSQSQQEPFGLDQEPAQNQECSADQSQEQFVNHAGSSIEAYCALLQASELGSSQEPPPPAEQSLTEEQQLRLQLAQLVGGIGIGTAPAGAPEAAANHEELIQTTADLPLPTDQESCTTEQLDGNMGQDGHFFVEWSDIERFWGTTGVQAGDDVATGILAGAGHGDGCGACC